MTKVIYTGTSDFQEFSADDFKKAEVEDQKKVVFARGEATEVSDAAAEALVSSQGIFAGHSFELEKTDEPDSEGVEDELADDEGADALVSQPEAVGPAAELSGDDAKTEGTADTTTPKGAKTGKGSSTKGKA